MMLARRAGYAIVDEPRPSGLARVAVRPLWPLLSLMIGGALFSWAWFALNAHALGVPRPRRTYAWIAAAVVGTAFLVVTLDVARTHLGLPTGAVPWVALLILLWKLTVAYALFFEQSPTSELFAYFGGRLRNGGVGVALAFVMATYGLDELPGRVGSALHDPVLADVAMRVLR